MAMTLKTTVDTFGTASRRVAAALVAGVWRRRSLGEVEERIASLSRLEQGIIVGGVLGLVFALSLLAAQFGWVAMLGFWLAVILIVN